MAGTVSGGKLAAKTNKERHGEDFYRIQGQIGGKVTGVKKGFAANPELARKAGSIGGSRSKRGKAVAKAPVVIQDNGGLDPTPYNGFEPASDKKKKLWIF